MRASRVVLRGGRVVDPLTGRDEMADLLLVGDRTAAIGPDLDAGVGALEIELSGELVVPGLVDPHVHLREPGNEDKETVASGAAAAVAGGYATVCAMPNTNPVIDSPERVQDLRARARAARTVRVRPIAAATVGSDGERATDAVRLREAGAVALSDDGRPIVEDRMLAEVLRGAWDAGLVVADHCECLSRSAGGAIYDSPLASELGVGGIPPEAESEAVGRDLEIVAHTGGRLHLCHLSTAQSVALLRGAIARDLSVTAEVTPHHLVLTADAVRDAGAAAKMNPPLALEADRDALRAALADGTITSVATDHAPHTAEEKAIGLDRAPFGIVGLETAFAVLYTELVEPGVIPLSLLIERMTAGPAEALGLTVPALGPGARADVAVFDVEHDWTVDAAAFRSRGRNTPFDGWTLRGRPVMTIVHGRVVYDAREIA